MSDFFTRLVFKSNSLKLMKMATWEYPKWLKVTSKSWIQIWRIKFSLSSQVDIDDDGYDKSNTLWYKLTFNHNPCQNIWQEVKKNEAKLGQTRKFRYLILYKFWLLSQKIDFWRGNLIIAFDPNQCWNDPFISYFIRTLVLYTKHTLIHKAYYTRYQVSFYFG